MNWLVLIIAFALGALVAAAAVRRFRQTAAGWSAVRRVVSAAALVPAALLALVSVGTIWARATLPDGGEGGRQITTFVIMIVGAVLCVPALLGGLVGAVLVERGGRR